MPAANHDSVTHLGVVLGPIEQRGVILEVVEVDAAVLCFHSRQGEVNQTDMLTSSSYVQRPSPDRAGHTQRYGQGQWTQTGLVL